MGIAERVRQSIETGRGKEQPIAKPEPVKRQYREGLPPEDVITDTVLFACVANPAYLADARQRVQSDDWPLLWQRRVWAQIERRAARGQRVSIVTLRPVLSAYDADLLARACAATANPYQADYVGILARLGQAERERETALREACAVKM